MDDLCPDDVLLVVLSSAKCWKKFDPVYVTREDDNTVSDAIVWSVKLVDEDDTEGAVEVRITNFVNKSFVLAVDGGDQFIICHGSDSSVTAQEFPFAPKDASDKSGTKMSIFYGTINTVALSSQSPGQWSDAITITDSGLYYVHFKLDGSTREVTEVVEFGSVADEASMPSDSSTDVYIVLGKFSSDSKSKKATFDPIVTTNLNFTEYTVAINGTLCHSYFATYERDPVPLS